MLTIVTLRKHLRTFAAFERSFASMRAYVQNQIVLHRERLLTHVTFKRSFIRVQSKMSTHILCEVKTFLAHVTLVFAHIFVHVQYVSLEFVVFAIRLAAFVARKHFHIVHHVNAVMLPKGDPLGVCLVASVAFKWALFCVAHLMVRQVGWFAKTLVACGAHVLAHIGGVVHVLFMI
jgi:hypothetical protein